MGKRYDGNHATYRKKWTHNPPPSEFVVKLCYWNANGICSLKSQWNHSHIAEVIESEAIDILMIDETHLKYNNQVDFSVFSEWRWVGRDRGHPDKAGGGKLFSLLTKAGMADVEPSTT